MKKTLIRIFALVLTICTLFSLASCFAPKPELDLEKAAENLEDEDYYAGFVDDEDYLEFNMTEMMFAIEKDADFDLDDLAYVFSDPTELGTELIVEKTEFLMVVTYADSKSAKYMHDNLKLALDYAVDSAKLNVKAMENTVKEYEDDLDNDDIDNYEDDIKDINKMIERVDEEIVLGKSGNTVWFGTKKAIEESKG